MAAKLGRLKTEALNQLLDIFELPRGSGEEGHKVGAPSADVVLLGWTVLSVTGLHAEMRP